MRRKPQWVKETATKRIASLLDQAKGSKRAKRYVELALKESEKYKAPLPEKYQNRVCKKCFAFLTPGKNQIIRVTGDRKVFKCLECGAATTKRLKNPPTPKK